MSTSPSQLSNYSNISIIYSINKPPVTQYPSSLYIFVSWEAIFSLYIYIFSCLVECFIKGYVHNSICQKFTQTHTRSMLRRPDNTSVHRQRGFIIRQLYMSVLETRFKKLQVSRASSHVYVLCACINLLHMCSQTLLPLT
jgi:hypothetical protein